MTGELLLLVERRGNRQQLEEWAKRAAALRIVGDRAGVDADLIIVDGPGLARHRERLERERMSADSAFLPVLLVLPERQAEQVTPDLWTVIDDVATTPIRPAELRVRVDRLLSRRRTSLESAFRAEELTRSNTDLERFAFVAAHELRSPLAVVTGFVETLGVRHRDALSEGAASLLDEALAGCRRMAGIVDDLLASSRAHQRVPHGRVDCNVVVADALAELRREVEESGAAIRVDELPAVDGDATLLRLVFRNLLSNAIKFRRPDTAPDIEVGGEAGDGVASFCVADDGIGIPAEDAGRVFDFFERGRVRDGYAGSGIGLATCRRIVERHGGRIWCVPGERTGAVIRFTLPAAD